ncbi:MAG: nucleotide exchange factor GrpE [Bacteroidales bacterium]|nr:MAG: nucleotide exchange factor GrpE [Bacteroidales bacterium]
MPEKEETKQSNAGTGKADKDIKTTTKTYGKSTKKKAPGHKHSSGTKEISYKEKIKELTDKYLRLSAEFDNYRKRTLKEKIELTKSAGEELLKNILPVMDDFERGINTINNANDITAVKQGIDLIYAKFKDFLNQNGVREIEAKDREFNIDYHEAVTKIPAAKKDLKGKVVDVVEKGYTLNDKVIRYSKVVIGE